MANFFGLVVKAGSTISADIPEMAALNISQAALVNAKDGPVKLFCTVEDQRYIICTLNSTTLPQQAVSLSFFFDQPVSFSVEGSGEVHLIGYVQEIGDSESEGGFSDEEDMSDEGQGEGLEDDDEGEEDGEDDGEENGEAEKKRKIPQKNLQPAEKKQKIPTSATEEAATCVPCSKSFKNQEALAAHKQAKHTAAAGTPKPAANPKTPLSGHKQTPAKKV